MIVTRTRLIVVGAITAAFAVAVVAWAWSTNRDQPETSEWQVVFSALCSASGAAEDRRTDTARRLFEDQAHDPLHSLAQSVAESDRAQAARLLEAKEAVESNLDASPERLGTLLAHLASETRASADTIDDPIPSGCGTGGQESR